MSSVTSYSVSRYGNLIANGVHLTAYAQALRQQITPESIVLDIGSGTGVFALLACQYGARKVYAIESGDCIQVARELAHQNGFSDRLIFIQGISTEVNLPEKVDIIVSDLRGELPLFEQHIPTIVDARERFLAPNGVLLPQQDELWATLVSSASIYQHTVKKYESDLHTLNVQPATQRLINERHHLHQLPARAQFTQPKLWQRLDYRSRKDPNASGSMCWDISQPGIVHGIGLWFDAVVDHVAQFSNAPGEPETVYGRSFFPWPQAVNLAVGDSVQVKLSAHYINGDYIWRWDTHIDRANGSPEQELRFQQSTFYAMPLTRQGLTKQSEQYRPTLNEAGQIQLFILEKMGQGEVIGTIASQVVKQFPQRFASRQQAMSHISDLVKEHCGEAG